MDLDDIRSALFGGIEDNWADTPIAIPNRQYDPNGIRPDSAYDGTDGYWIMLTLLPGVTFGVEVGESGIGIRAGVLMVSVFGPKNSGIKQALTYAGKIESIFRRKTLSGVMCGDPYTEDRGVDPNGFYHIVTTIPWETWVGEG